MNDQLLKLVEKTDNKICDCFNEFHEKFETKKFNQVTTNTKIQLDCVMALIGCLDKNFFENETLHEHFDNFLQNISIELLTYVEFQTFNKQENLKDILNQLLIASEELKNQTDTVIVKLPVIEKNLIDLKTNFNKSFISINRKNESFLFFTNNNSLIKLYEKL